MLKQIAVKLSSDAAPAISAAYCLSHNHGLAALRMFRTSVCVNTGTPDIHASFQSEFARNPKAAAAAVAALSEEHQARVIAAIAEQQAEPGSPKYIHKLFQNADRNQDGILDTQELGMALKQHGVLKMDTRVDAPKQEDLIRVFTASALPFIGFGFLDNLIMILAGDYIDATLGGALCLSTMAAAGLGNLVSDVAGIFCADYLEDKARVFKYGRFPSLSPVQMRLPSVTRAKTVGAVIGISIGCILGMFPLLLMSPK